MIKSFADKTTEALFNRERVSKLPPSILKVGYRKLVLIDVQSKLRIYEFRQVYRLEKLSGNLSDKYSIRINNQWRIVFSWVNNNAEEVEIEDYHKG